MNLITIVTTAVVVISIAVAIICLVLGLAFGATEQQCVKINTKTFKEIGIYDSWGVFNIHDCNWVVQKMLTNGSGFHVTKWSIGSSKASDWQYFIMEKQ